MAGAAGLHPARWAGLFEESRGAGCENALHSREPPGEA